jgi:threonyl-tRNA synthetase
VVGDKEVDKKTLSVTIREESSREERKVEEMTALELRRRIEENLKNYPFRELPLPQKLSERPRFVGG